MNSMCVSNIVTEFIKPLISKGEEIYELCKQGKEEREKAIAAKNRNNIIKQSLYPFSILYKLYEWNIFFIHLSDTSFFAVYVCVVQTDQTNTKYCI